MSVAAQGPPPRGPAVRGRVEAARAAAGAALGRGEPGEAVARRLSAALDVIVVDLVAHVGLAGVAVFATGGWGRGEACPRSDLDVLFLGAAGEDGGGAERVLYPLWDAGIEVGHAVRTVDGAAALAAADLPTLTALLDARQIAGDPGAAVALAAALAEVVAAAGPRAVVAALAAERRARHARFETALYRLEPNLKLGRGGGRDLATARWAARLGFGAADFADLVRLGEASPRQAAALFGARDLLLAVRAQLHLAAGRRQDQLTFELQERLVAGGGRTPQPETRRLVEALLRRVYLATGEVARITDWLLERATAQPREVRHSLGGCFARAGDRLVVTDPAALFAEPALAVRLFRVALDAGLAPAGEALALAAEIAAHESDRLAADAAAAAELVALIVDDRDIGPPSLLGALHETGLLGAILPAFAPCTARAQHDLYHVYTVDQHQLFTLAEVKRLLSGQSVSPGSAAAARQGGAASSRRVLAVAALLHDVAKPLGRGHAEKGAPLAEAAALHLGLSAAEAARVAFLVRHHLDLGHLAERRDLSDTTLVARFAALVGDEGRLAELFLLSLADAAMTAPGNLGPWKATLFGELYERTAGHLRRGPDLAGGYARRRLEARRRAVEARLDGGEREALPGWLEDMPERYLATTRPGAVVRHFRLSRGRGVRRAALAVAGRRGGVAEVAVVADDEPGLLARLAGVLTVARLDILAAEVFSRAAGAEALDVFVVRDRGGRPLPANDPRWAELEVNLGGVLAGEIDLAGLLAVRAGASALDRRTPGVPTAVHIELGRERAVVELVTRDRPGLLHDVASALHAAGLDISLSRVATEAERVADVFYVHARDGRPFVPEDAGRIEAAVTAAVDGDAALPAGRAR